MDHIHEECGVFGIYSSRKSDLASLAYYALFALQHRGQESAGIAVNDDGVFKAVKGEGLVSEVFGDAKLRSLGSGNIEVGHVRYATTGAGLSQNIQPLLVNHHKGRMALCHNGNLSNSVELRTALEEKGAIFHTTTDSEVISYMIVQQRLKTGSIESAVSAAMDVIKGGCNVQFALDPHSFQYYVIEVNPRVSRSSALASKASGYPIARVSAKIGVGLRLDEIPLANTPASFEPALNYVVTKIPRFPFDKFADAPNTLGPQMKATGEIMSVGRTMEESLLKGIRSIETDAYHLYLDKFSGIKTNALLAYIEQGTDDRIFALAELLRRGADIEQLFERTQIDRFFLRKIRNIVDTERELSAHIGDKNALYTAKRMGFSDRAIARFWNTDELTVYQMRKDAGIIPVFKMIDTCASEFKSYVPYFYSTYEQENESIRSDKKRLSSSARAPSASVRAWSSTTPLSTRCRRSAAQGMRRSSSIITPRRSLPTIPPPTSSISSPSRPRT